MTSDPQQLDHALATLVTVEGLIGDTSGGSRRRIDRLERAARLQQSVLIALCGELRAERSRTDVIRA